MFVDEGVEGHPVSPAGGEVVDVDIGIPAQEGSHSLSASPVRSTFIHDVCVNSWSSSA